MPATMVLHDADRLAVARRQYPTALDDEAWLRQQYLTQQRSAIDIARELGCTHATVLQHMRKVGIVRRPRNWSRWRVDEKGRECSKCGHYKSWDKFWEVRPDPRRQCPVEAMRTHRSSCIACEDKEAARTAIRMHRLRTYGLSTEQYEKLKADQGGVCYLCRQPQKISGKPTAELDIDHDRRCCPNAQSCGKCVRGLLCRSCNRLVGRLESAFPVLALVSYVDRRPLDGGE